MAEDGSNGTDAENDAQAATATGNVYAEQLTSYQRDLLLIVASQSQFDDVGEHSGSASKRALENYYGKSLQAGRFYPNMNKLVEHGLVEKAALEINDRTHSYTITEKGKRELRERHDWWDSMYPLASTTAIVNGGESGSEVEAEGDE